MNRRDFSQSLLTAAALSTCGISLAMSSTSNVALSKMSKASFEAMLNQEFASRSLAANKTHALHLHTIESAGYDEQYYLRFRHSSAQQIEEDIYALISEQGEQIMLYLQASATDSKVLEAVVNLKQV